MPESGYLPLNWWLQDIQMLLIIYLVTSILVLLPRLFSTIVATYLLISSICGSSILRFRDVDNQRVPVPVSRLELLGNVFFLLIKTGRITCANKKNIFFLEVYFFCGDGGTLGLLICVVSYYTFYVFFLQAGRSFSQFFLHSQIPTFSSFSILHDPVRVYFFLFFVGT